MPRAGHFKQLDVTKAVRAVKMAGIDVGRVEIDPEGRIAIVARGTGGAAPANEWDQEFEE